VREGDSFKPRACMSAVSGGASCGRAGFDPIRYTRKIWYIHWTACKWGYARMMVVSSRVFAMSLLGEFVRRVRTEVRLVVMGE
jgi:hypothetical protein